MLVLFELLPGVLVGVIALVHLRARLIVVSVGWDAGGAGVRRHRADGDRAGSAANTRCRTCHWARHRLLQGVLLVATLLSGTDNNSDHNIYSLGLRRVPARRPTLRITTLHMYDIIIINCLACRSIPAQENGWPACAFWTPGQREMIGNEKQALQRMHTLYIIFRYSDNA